MWFLKRYIYFAKSSHIIYCVYRCDDISVCVCVHLASNLVVMQLGILLNSMKRMLDVLRPKVEHQLKSWGSCIPDGGNTAPGERLSEVTVMLRSKFRTYLQAVVEKLAENVSIFYILLLL